MVCPVVPTEMSSKRPQTDQDVARYREKCNAILALSPSIRYVGIMNRFGRTLAGGLRKGVTPLLKPDEARNEYFIEATRNQLRKNFEKSIGRTEYTFTENEKVKILTLSTEENFYYITIDKEAPQPELYKLVDSVRKLLRQ
jgi:hypothetical protein